jgi:TPR repeat protein
MRPTGTKPAESSQELKRTVRDRRWRVRHKVHTPAYASLNGTSASMALNLCEIVNISEEGMAIQTSSPLELIRNLNLCLDLSETKAYIHTIGQIIWSNRSGRAGIHFPAMPDACLRRLKEWLFANAIAGYVDQESAQTPQPEPEALTEPPREAVVQATTLQVEGEAATSPPPGYSSIWTALTAVKREVELIGPDLDASLQVIAERALTFTRATGAAIALLRGEQMTCLASAGLDAPGLGARLQVGSGFSGECVRTGRLLRCDDSEIDPSVDRESCRMLGVRSMIAVPICSGDVVIGLLEVFSPNPNAFSANDSTVLQRLAETAEVAVNRAAQASAAGAGLFGTLTGAVTSGEAAAADKFFVARLHTTLLGAIPVALAIVLLWLLVPWIKSLTGPSSRTSSQPEATLHGPTSKTLARGGAGDLEGLRRLARQGDSAAQFALGARYATGENVKQDYSEAVRWFAMAAERGHVVAQATLGAYYWAGRGVSPDLNKAYFWSLLAQAGGDEASKYRVAVLASRMTHAQIVAAQQQANDWLKQHHLDSAAR